MTAKEIYKFLKPFGLKQSEDNPYEYELRGLYYDFEFCKTPIDLLAKIANKSYNDGFQLGSKEQAKQETQKLTVFEIWNGDGLTWSTINDLVGEDQPERNLRQLTLELVQELNTTHEKLIAINEEVEDVDAYYNFITSNIKACLELSKRSFNKDHITFLTNDQKSIVSIQRGKEPNEMEIKEQFINY